MFEFFNSMDGVEPGEVEMVSLVPDFDEPEVMEVPEVVIIEKIQEPEIEEIEEIEEPAIEEIEEPQVEEAVPVVEKRKESGDKVAMSRIYEVDGKRIEIAYINYNKVRITRGKEAPIIKEFASTKEAVDYYVEQMQEFEIDE